MKEISRINEAKCTCDGLQRLVRQLNGAVVDVDKGGASMYELLALLATANTCVNNLSVQLAALADTPAHLAVTPLNSPEAEANAPLLAANG